MILKQCPFCHDDKQLWFKVRVVRDSFEEHCVRCDNCGAEGPSAESGKLAAELWNERGAEKDKDATWRSPETKPEKLTLIIIGAVDGPHIEYWDGMSWRVCAVINEDSQVI